MTSTTTGLPDRYRPIDEIAAEEPTPNGVIRSWRARDRVLNRDVALRVHTPGGPAAREWITRALTAGGLASPALAMVYDAAEGTGGTGPGAAAYVVNEWIEGPRLSDRLAEGPLPEREARSLVRRLAEGVAEAHRVGLAVGGLVPENVVLRAGGLVGLLSVPAATGTVHGDIAALGGLLEDCLTGRRPDTAPRAIDAPDLAALVRRARSEDPAAGLSSVNTLVALLAERPRTGPAELVRPDGMTETGWLRRLRDRRELEDAAAGARGDTGNYVLSGRPPLPPVPGARRRDAVPAPTGWDEPAEDDLDWDSTFGHGDEVAPEPDTRDGASRNARRKLLVLGLPVLALALVVGIGLWMGTSVLSVASSSVDEGRPGSVPSVSGSAAPSPSAAQPSSSAPSSPVAGPPARIAGISVFDPGGDGQPDNASRARRATDGNPATSWSTVSYRNSARFGNLKPGVGLLLDLGSPQSLAGVRLQSPTPGVTVEVRTGQATATTLDAFPVAGSTTLTGDDDVAFTAPVDARYVLVWLTGLVPADGGFAGSLSEVSVTTAR